MREVEVSAKVWERLLAVRYGDACTCCGSWTAGEKAALLLYGPIARRDASPLIVGQIGQSIDGRIASTNGAVGKVSGPDGLLHLHRLRALVDAVVVGVKTALHDAPRLTVRLCEGENPARVVIDPNGRLPDNSPILNDDGSRRIVIQSVSRVRGNGIEVIQIPATEGHIHPGQIIESLREKGLSSILVEGGSFSIANFMAADLLDRLQVTVAPVLIGSGPQGLTVNINLPTPGTFIRSEAEVFSVGSEIIFDCSLTETAVEAKKPRHVKN
jgi:riboflavin-specific deaminase-like protein